MMGLRLSIREAWGLVYQGATDWRQRFLRALVLHEAAVAANVHGELSA